MENTGFDFWMFIAGPGIFLFGMRYLEDSIKVLQGDPFRICCSDSTSQLERSSHRYNHHRYPAK